jgi:quercetin dioxygenase-like cupin family protein
MLRTFQYLMTALFLSLVPVAPLGAENLSIYQDRIETKDIDRVLSENSLLPDENIRSTFLYQTELASIHLVQIRVKEKPHIHKMHDLLVILKRGEGVVQVGGETVFMKKGDSILIPRGVIHFFENKADEVAVGLGIFTPPYDGTDMIPIESP